MYVWNADRLLLYRGICSSMISDRFIVVMNWEIAGLFRDHKVFYSIYAASHFEELNFLSCIAWNKGHFYKMSFYLLLKTAHLFYYSQWIRYYFHMCILSRPLRVWLWSAGCFCFSFPSCIYYSLLSVALTLTADHNSRFLYWYSFNVIVWHKYELRRRTLARPLQAVSNYLFARLV